MIFLLIDKTLSTTYLHRLSDHMAVCVIEKSDTDTFLKDLPQSDIYIINISTYFGINFYELNYDKSYDIVYYRRDETIICNPHEIGYKYLITKFPIECKDANELKKRLFIHHNIKLNTKCNSCFDFIFNRITCGNLCKSLFRGLFACS